jgi:hypothetical protein
MELAVFQEFVGHESLEKIRSLIPSLSIDVAPSPCALAKTDSELDVVRTNAKLLFPATTPAEEVDATLAVLTTNGFNVMLRHPVTSAGCPMRDRVILKFGVAAATTAA